MKKFLSRLALFIIPVLLYLSVPAYTLYRSQENFSNPDNVLTSGEKYLLGYAYNESNYHYIKGKTLATQQRKTVLAWGSSRVLQFRSGMFTESFYNAGYTVSGLRDFVPFLKSIPKEKYPAYLIINLDQWMFNPAWDNFSGEIENDPWKHSFSKNPGLSVINKSWKDLFAGKYTLAIAKPVSPVNHIGLNAIVNKKGFRNDGSMDYGVLVNKLMKDTAMHYKDTYERIRLGIRRFEPGNDINPKSIPEMEKLLAYCKKNGINVVAFLPPVGDDIYKKMQASGKYSYWEKIYPAINPIFKKYGFELYDFPTATSCGSNDNETIDGFHGGEKTTLKMLLKMLHSGSVLQKVTNREQLQLDLQHPVNRYQIYP